MMTETHSNGPHPFEQAVAQSPATFYHLEQTALQQATIQSAQQASPY